MTNLIIEKARKVIEELDAMPKSERPLWYRLGEKKIKEKFNEVAEK